MRAICSLGRVLVAKLCEAEQLRAQPHLLHVMTAAFRAETHVNNRRSQASAATSAVHAGINLLPFLAQIRLADFDGIGNVRHSRSLIPDFRLVTTHQGTVEGFSSLVGKSRRMSAFVGPIGCVSCCNCLP